MASGSPKISWPNQPRDDATSHAWKASAVGPPPYSETRMFLGSEKVGNSPLSSVFPSNRTISTTTRMPFEPPRTRTSSTGGSSAFGTAGSPRVATETNGKAVTDPVGPGSLDDWDPMLDDFSSPSFNTYDQGPGSLLPQPKAAQLRMEEGPTGYLNQARQFREGTSGGRSASTHNTQDGVALYVANIPRLLTKEGLKNLFSRVGNVKRVFLCSEFKGYRDTTYGFVTYETLNVAEQAIREFSDFEVGNERLAVKIHKARGGAPGGGGGGGSPFNKSRSSPSVSERSGQSHIDSSIEERDKTVPLQPTPWSGSPQGTPPASAGAGRTSPFASLKAGEHVRAAHVPSSASPLARLTSTVLSNTNATTSTNNNTANNNNITTNSNNNSVVGVVDQDLRPPQALLDQPLPGSSGPTSPTLPQQQAGSFPLGPAPSTSPAPSEQPEGGDGDRGGLRSCVYCGEASSKRCVRCKAPYCSATCQQQHWPEHCRTCVSEDEDSSPPATATVVVAGGSSSSQQGFDEEAPLPMNGADFDLSLPHLHSHSVVGPAVEQVEAGAAPVRDAVERSAPRPASDQPTPGEDLGGSGGPAPSSAVEAGQPLPSVNSLPSCFKVTYCHSTGHRFSLFLAEVHCRERQQVLEGIERWAGSGEHSPLDASAVSPSQVVLVEMGGSYSRARVDVVKGDLVSVVFVDGSVFASTQRVYACPQDLQAVPTFCRKFALANVRVLDHQDSVKGRDYFRSLVGDETLRASVVGENTFGSLVLLHDGRGRCINDLLLESKCVIRYQVKLQQQKKSPRRHSALEGPSSEQRNWTSHLPAHDAALEGSSVDVRITVVYSPEHMWGQARHAHTHQLAALIEAMTQHYAPTTNAGYKPLQGELCAALFTQDRSWYRADVIADAEDGSYLVRFVDFGNKTKVSLAELRYLSEQYRSFPRQSLHFQLAGVRGPSEDGAWTAAVKNELRQQLEGRIVQAEIVGYSQPFNYHVKVFDPDRPSVLINEALIESGAAQRAVLPPSVSRPLSSKPSAAGLGRAFAVLELARGVGGQGNALLKPALKTPPFERKVTFARDLVEAGERRPGPGTSLGLLHLDGSPRSPRSRDFPQQSPVEEGWRATGRKPYSGGSPRSPRSSSWNRSADRQRSEGSEHHQQSSLPPPSPAGAGGEGGLPGSTSASVAERVAPAATPPALQQSSTDTPPPRQQSSTDTPPPRQQSSTDTPPPRQQSSTAPSPRQQSSTDTPPPQQQSSTDTPPPRQQSSTAPPPPRQQSSIAPSPRQQSSTATPPPQQQSSTAPPKPTLPEVGDQFSALITQLDSADAFYIQRLTAEHVALMESMSQQSRGAAPLQTCPAVGQYCMACFEGDFYRARVLELCPEQQRVLVKFVDFGNREKVDLPDLRPISAPFLRQCLMCLWCGLAGNHSFRQGGLQFFSSLVCSQNVQIRVVGREGNRLLVGVHFDDGRNIADVLTEKGFMVAKQLKQDGLPCATTPTSSQPPPLQQSPPQQTLSQQPQLQQSTSQQPQLQQSSSQQPKLQQSSSQQQHGSVSSQAPPTPMMEGLPRLSLQVGQVVLLVEVDTPEQFWVQTASEDTMKQLQTLEGQIKGCVTSPTAAPFPPGQPEGSLCIAKFNEDAMWYRACSVKEESHGYLVQFIDYGNLASVSYSDILVMPPTLLSSPPLVIPCCLEGVGPAAGGAWSADAAALLKDIARDKPLLVQEARKEGDRWRVGLFIPKDQTVADKLVGSGVARALGGSAQSSRPDSSSFGSGSATMPQPAQPQHSSPLQQQHTSPIQQQQQPPRSSLPVQPKLSPPPASPLPTGGQVTGLVLLVESPEAIWFQLLGGSGPSALISLCQDLTAFAASCPAHPEPWTAGDCCCVRCPDDECWYRARVLTVQGDQAMVRYVDFGVTCEAGVSGLRPLSPDSASLPVQAVRGRLHGVQGWGREATEFLKQRLDNQQVSLRVVVGGEAAEVDVLDPTSGGGGSIGRALVAAGLARSAAVQPPPKPLSPTRPAFDSRQPVLPSSPRGADQSSVSPQQQPRFVSSSNQKPHAVSSSPQQSLSAVPTQVLRNAASKDPRPPPPSAAPACHTLQDCQFVALPSEPVFKVLVGHVIGPGQMWIQVATADNIHRLTQLMDDIDAHATSGSLQRFSRPPRAGQVCLARFSEDGNWYRAGVLEVLKSACSVQFLDFGNSETVPAAALAQLPESFLALPLQALSCSLAGLPLPTHSAPSPATTGGLRELVDGHCLQCEVLGRAPLLLRLSALDSPSGLTVRDNLVRMQLLPAVEDSALVQVEPTQLSASESTAVLVSHNTGPHDLYLQLVSQSAIESFGHLSQQLNSYGPQAHPLQPEQCCFGQVVCARFSEDQCWYRGRVEAVLDRSSVRVRFVDYGNTDVLSTASLAPLLPEFTHLPAQAVPCCLEGFSGSAALAASTAQVRARLQELVEGRSLVGRVCGRLVGDSGAVRYLVDLVDTSSQDDVSISLALQQ